MASVTDKEAIRAEATVRRDTITTATREAASAAIAENAIDIVERAGPRTISAYMPIWSEADPRPILLWAFDNDINVLLPAVEGDGLVFRRYRRDDPLVAGRWGTVAPGPHAEVGSPELMISPMLAFDRTGVRLGYGGGFYDRAMARLHSAGKRPLIVGIAFASQEVPAIPAEPHDVRMDWIVTERETLDFRR